MKTLLSFVLLLGILAGLHSPVHAQADNQATFEKYLADVYAAYARGDEAAMWAFYTNAAAEISPDGTLTSGVPDLKKGWAQFMTMVDQRPTFTSKLTSWRLITPDVAILTWDSTADILVHGEQMGGPATCSAVLHKVKGKWYIEFDTMTPALQMPEHN